MRPASGATQDHVRPAGRVLLPHVDDRHRRQRPIEHAARQHDAARTGRSARCDSSPSTASPIPAPPARRPAARGRPRRRGRGSAGSPPACTTPSCSSSTTMRPRRSKRREDGGARADDDVHVAAADAVPLIVPLAVGQAAVLNRDALAEASTGRCAATAGVSAISGTSISTPRPARCDRAARRRYSSVLPLPVTPCSRTVRNARSQASADSRSKAACCSSVDTQRHPRSAGRGRLLERIALDASGARSSRGPHPKALDRRRRNSARCELGGVEPVGRAAQQRQRLVLPRSELDGGLVS